MRRVLRAAAGVAAVSLLSLGMSVPSASAIEARCLYPPTKPTLSIGLSTTAPVAGKAVYVKGRLRYNTCGVAGRPTTAKAGTKSLGTKNTDSFGYYAFRFVPLTRTSVSARSSYNGVAAASRSIKMSVRTNIKGTFSAPGSCRVSVSGSTYPKKRSVIVYVQRRLTSGGRFVGWSTVAKVRTTTTGTFRATVKRPCGSKTGMSVYIAAMTGNAAGRTPTVTVTARR